MLILIVNLKASIVPSAQPSHPALPRAYWRAIQATPPRGHDSPPLAQSSTPPLPVKQAEQRPLDGPCTRAFSSAKASPSIAPPRQPLDDPRATPLDSPTLIPFYNPSINPAATPRHTRPPAPYASPYLHHIPPLRERSCVPPRQPHRRAAATPLAAPRGDQSANPAQRPSELLASAPSSHHPCQPLDDPRATPLDSPTLIPLLNPSSNPATTPRHTRLSAPVASPYLGSIPPLTPALLRTALPTHRRAAATPP